MPQRLKRDREVISIDQYKQEAIQAYIPARIVPMKTAPRLSSSLRRPVTGSMGNSDMTSTRLAKGDAASTQSLSSQNSYAVCSELPVQQMHKSLAADRQVDVGKMSKMDRRSAPRLLLLLHAPDALD
jgi:hypothetical protein